MSIAYKKFDLTGKTAFVTGGGTGIGYYLARGLARSGAKVMIAARREEVLSTAADKLTKEADGNQVLYTTIDLSDRDNIYKTAEQAIDVLGGVDIFVGNAAQEVFGLIDDVHEADADRLFNVNVTSNMTLSKLFLPHMRKKQWGRIIFSSSIVSHLSSGVEGMSIYAASKSALNGLARAIAVDVGHDGITANAIVFGAFLTDMLENTLNSMPADIREGVVESLTSVNALGRLANPEEVEGIIQLLASNAGSFITGADIPVEGGWKVTLRPNLKQTT